ncbi:unnamed protein product [Allacma fusca]|uniref:CRAL-TRIO domain-containing protein n=1 Tax=Allacma fusca TaxID=39272 RepID=A0A8J2LCR5_9HEXA|nr:unnamed protein product [Allacma fusca]
MKLFILFTILGIALGQEITDKNKNLVADYKDIDTEALLTWEAPREFQKAFPYYLSGFDEENAPIWIAEFGKWDVRKIIESGPENEKILRRYIQQFLKRAVESRSLKSTADIPVTEVNCIIDMEGYGSQQASSPPTLAVTMWFAGQIEQAWRNKLKSGFIVNSNYLFTTVWNLMKPLLGRNVYKVEVFGNNKDRWIPALLKTFPKSQIPEWYGGNKDHTPVKIYG